MHTRSSSAYGAFAALAALFVASIGCGSRETAEDAVPQFRLPIVWTTSNSSCRVGVRLLDLRVGKQLLVLYRAQDQATGVYEFEPGNMLSDIITLGDPPRFFALKTHSSVSLNGRIVPRSEAEEEALSDVGELKFGPQSASKEASAQWSSIFDERVRSNLVARRVFVLRISEGDSRNLMNLTFRVPVRVSPTQVTRYDTNVTYDISGSCFIGGEALRIDGIGLNPTGMTTAAVVTGRGGEVTRSGNPQAPAAEQRTETEENGTMMLSGKAACFITILLKAKGGIPEIDASWDGSLCGEAIVNPKTVPEFPFNAQFHTVLSDAPRITYGFVVTKTAGSSPWAMTKAWKQVQGATTDLALPSPGVQSAANAELLHLEQNVSGPGLHPPRSGQ